MSSDSDDTQPPLADTHGSSAPLASRKRPLTTKDEETGLDVWLECKEGSIEEVDEALEQGVDLNIADPDPLGFTLLMNSIVNEHLDAFQKLLSFSSNGVSRGYGDSDGTDTNTASSEMSFKNLLGPSLDPNPHGLVVDINHATANHGTVPLYVAAWEGNDTCVKLLLDAGADVKRAKTSTGYTPLYVAAQDGHTSCVLLLIAAGSDVDEAPESSGCSPLFVACEEGHVDCVAELLKAGANPNQAETYDNVTPLNVATSMGSTEIVSLLLERGADPKIGEEAKPNKRYSSVAMSWGQETSPDQMNLQLCKSWAHSSRGKYGKMMRQSSTSGLAVRSAGHPRRNYRTPGRGSHSQMSPAEISARNFEASNSSREVNTSTDSSRPSL